VTHRNGYLGRRLQSSGCGCRIHPWLRLPHRMDSHPANYAAHEPMEVCLHLHGVGGDCSQLHSCSHWMALLGWSDKTEVSTLKHGSAVRPWLTGSPRSIALLFFIREFHTCQCLRMGYLTHLAMNSIFLGF